MVPSFDAVPVCILVQNVFHRFARAGMKGWEHKGQG